MADLNIIQHPSPNFGGRRDGVTPDMIVLHYTAMPTAQAALQRLSDPKAEVSAHYLIGRCGQIWQMVEEDKRAWHAGAGSWGGQGDVNSRSIGIELSNSGAEPFSELLMSSLEALLRDLMARWDIAPERVIGHSDMAPLRKQDPGARFDWQRLALQGLSVWPELKFADSHFEPDFWNQERILEFAELLRQIGYDVPVGELPGAVYLAQFSSRFVKGRPVATGHAFAAAMDLANRYPARRA
ncbi:N-acetylmuramoyl-L-alanine amidase [Thalassovita sp.]|uniref:N-acetylmuramoyl-L-alanine amidase n=1 Tax=Thalassovita sp. TaxID=1979401 RepID=UPI002AAF0DA8|nr:N-acetylmuramoyl-L-alanine amidase [Thalassovita sp.]